MQVAREGRLIARIEVACSKRSDSGERCGVKKAMKSRGGLGSPLSPLLLPRFYFFALLFTSHRSPLSERLEQASIEGAVVARFARSNGELAHRLYLPDVRLMLWRQ